MSAEMWPQRVDFFCPFCGNRGMYRGRFGHGVWVQCTNCGARGPEAISDAKARAAWVKRFDGCKVAGVYDYGDRDEYRVYALSCGHAFEWNDTEPPRYCPECGAKVVSK
jgi:predicted RNA-binding Zn-ribbon protein involved in translation (DUF1610 family)